MNNEPISVCRARLEKKKENECISVMTFSASRAIFTGLLWLTAFGT
jgi:hypothetical protein